MRTAKLKSAFNSFIIDPRGWQCETNLQDIMGWEYSMSCLSGGYKFALVLRCVGLVLKYYSYFI